jgi:hypothetical protein
MQNKHEILARRGLTLSRQVLKRLQGLGIVARSSVSLEYQQVAGRYVVRGIESGGAVRNLGRYVTFCGSDGEPLRYLHPLDAIGVNGVHAVIVAPVLVRVELFRAGRTCQMLITKHEPGNVEGGRRPLMKNSLLFRGVNGFLDVDPLREEGRPEGPSLPRFWSRSGEEREIAPVFAAAVQAATKGASCVGCSHAHFLAAPTASSGGAGRIC